MRYCRCTHTLLASALHHVLRGRAMQETKTRIAAAERSLRDTLEKEGIPVRVAPEKIMFGLMPTRCV